MTLKTLASRFCAILMLMVATSIWANSVRNFTLSADEWARPRSGSVIVEFESLKSAVSYWGRGIDAAMLVRYPGGDSGELWAAELRDWLISLGVPGDDIKLAPGNQNADEINLVVGNRNELNF